MKPFDLEAAKRGERVQYRNEVGFWLDAHFVGVTAIGLPVVQVNGCSVVKMVCDDEDVRMAPKKVTWNCRILVRDGQPFLSKGAYPIEWTESLSGGGHWHGEPFTVEVEE